MKTTCKFNENYTIYLDGRVYSSHFGGRFLKHYRYVSEKHATPHYAVRVPYNGIGKVHQISRLVMFHFGKHNYRGITEMPKIIFRDDDTKNFDLENLIFATSSEIIQKIYRLYPDSKKKIKDTPKNRAEILQRIKDKEPLNSISLDFNCSGMSVHRFAKRAKAAMGVNITEKVVRKRFTKNEKKKQRTLEEAMIASYKNRGYSAEKITKKLRAKFKET